MFRKNRPKFPNSPVHNGDAHPENQTTGRSPATPVTPVSRATLQFSCQLAHGSPTVFVSGFSSVKELYQKVGESFDFLYTEVILIFENCSSFYKL